MKRLQIMIEEDLDQALEKAAFAQKVSKSALIRQYMRERVVLLPSVESDPLMEMAGTDDFEPAAVDEVVYR